MKKDSEKTARIRQAKQFAFNLERNLNNRLGRQPKEHRPTEQNTPPDSAA